MSDIPTDLVPLPTMPYDERPVALPLDIEECRTALWRVRGNVTQAANLLKVPASRLRKFISNSPRLVAEVNEAREQLKDIAEDNVFEALTDEQDPGRRDQMSRFVLSTIGRDRGFASGGGVSVKNSKGGTVVIQWADGSSVVGNASEDRRGEDAKVVQGEVVDG